MDDFESYERGLGEWLVLTLFLISSGERRADAVVEGRGAIVRMIEVVNEPEKGCDESLRKVYYRNAQRVIRDTEKSLGVSTKRSRAFERED